MCSRHREDLKVKAFWKARNKSCLLQEKKKGKRGLKKSRVTPSLFCDSEIRRVDVGFCVKIPHKNLSPTFVKEEILAVEADMESLPLDILVRIVCNVRHDELEPLFHVSSKFREAASIAREMHFDYTTPVRVRASRKRTICLIPGDEISQNCISFEESECLLSSSRMPATPNAPKQLVKFHKSKMTSEELKDVATFLFPPPTPGNESERKFGRKSRLLRSGAAPNRVLFLQDDLCEAVQDELYL